MLKAKYYGVPATIEIVYDNKFKVVDKHHGQKTLNGLAEIVGFEMSAHDFTVARVTDAETGEIIMEVTNE
jgi:hypothetical protein